MLIEMLFSIILNYSEFQINRCVFHIANNVIVVPNNTLLNLVLAPEVVLTSKDVGVWDQCPNIVISSSNPRETFEKYEYFLRHYGDGMDTRKYIIHFEINQHEDFDSFFESPALYFVADLIVIKEFIDKCEVYTHKYVGTENHNQPQLLNVWFSNETFLYNNSLLPNKLANVQRRILNIGAAKYIPMSDPVNKRGLETMFLFEYVKKYNYTLRYDKREVRLGLLYPNKTATGFTKLMIQDQIDLVTCKW